MSLMSIPKSYAVLMGIEGYSRGMHNMQRVKKALGLEKGGHDRGDDGKKCEEGRKNKWNLDLGAVGNVQGEMESSHQNNGIEKQKPSKGRAASTTS